MQLFIIDTCTRKKYSEIYRYFQSDIKNSMKTNYQYYQLLFVFLLFIKFMGNFIDMYKLKNQFHKFIKWELLAHFTKLIYILYNSYFIQPPHILGFEISWRRVCDSKYLVLKIRDMRRSQKLNEIIVDLDTYIVNTTR